MGFRDSFSRLKKKVKHRLTGRKPKSNETRANVGGERVDSTGSRPEPEPRVVAGGSHDQGGKGPDAEGGQTLLTIRPPQPDELGPIPARGGMNDQERRGADVDGGEVEQAYSHLRSDVEVVERGGPAKGNDTIDGEKVEPIDPSLPATSVLHYGKPNST